MGVKNGIAGTRRGLDVSEWVNPRARAVGAEVYLEKNGKPSRGYLLRRRCKARFKTWLGMRVDAGDRIVLVGKSMGAHDILSAVEEVGCWEHCCALVFDPACSLQRGERHTRFLTRGDWVTVVRQRGYRSGYRVDGAADYVISAKHKTIERTRKAQDIGNNWLARQGLPRVRRAIS